MLSNSQKELNRLLNKFESIIDDGWAMRFNSGAKTDEEYDMLSDNNILKLTNMRKKILDLIE